MRIKGHEIPARKGLLTAASAAVVVVAISAFGRIALRTDLAHSQTSAEKYPSCGSVAVCINGGVNSQFYFGGIVSPKCIQTNGGERNKVGVGSCVSPSSTSMVAQTINAPNNNGIITQGQTGGSNTIIQAPVARHLNDGLKDQLLAHISKDRKVSVTFASTASDGGDLATEIKNFLEADGYSVTGPAMGFFAGSQPHGIIVSLHNDDLAKPVEVLVGTQ